MTLVIVATSALGVITICGGLFLRRLLGEIAELRRQITRVDRQMRALRAHVTFLRHLITEHKEDGEDDGGPPGEAAVANGYELPPGTATRYPPDRPQPVRSKGHLGLYIGGGLAAALATVSTAARDAIRAYRHQLIAATAGAAVTAATVTLVTVQPWNGDSDNRPPFSAPTAAPSSVYTPPPRPHPPHLTPGNPASPGSPSPTETGPEPGISESVTTSPSEATSPTVEPTGLIVPTVEPTGLIVPTVEPTGSIVPTVEPTGLGTPGPPGQSRRPTEPPGRATPPGQTHRPVAAGQTRTPGHSDEHPGRGVGPGLSVKVTLPLLDAGICIVCG